jgi:acetate kinase
MNTRTVTTVLCLNSGSSSIKAAAFDGDLHELGRAAAEGSTPASLAEVLRQLGATTPEVVVHRVVHGGMDYDAPCVIDSEVLRKLSDLAPLAPLHLPPALDIIRTAFDHFPLATHVACFDTAFHHDMPEVEQRYPLPKTEATKYVRRYGFHGLSCENVVASLNETQTRLLIVAHIGSGCSITAVKNGKSIANSMGFTPAGGIPMATRPGDLDPGLLVYLMNNGLSADELAHLINFDSGLKGIAGTGDMRALLERSDDDAELAVEMFCDRVAQQIGSYAVSLSGLATLAFTGGIGEHSTEVRNRITGRLQLLEPFEVVTIPTNEELVMARHALEFLPLRHV